MFKPKTPEAVQENVPTTKEELAAQLKAVPEQEQVRLAADYLEAKTTPVIEATRNALRQLAQKVEKQAV